MLPLQQNCLLCYNEVDISVTRKLNISPKGGKSNAGSRIESDITNSMLDRQINVIFVLTRLLDIPRTLCEDFLVRSEENPSEWFHCCSDCSEFVQEAKLVYMNMCKLMEDFKNCKTVAQAKLKNSKISQNENSKRRRLTSGLFLEEIRVFVFRFLGEKLNNLDAIGQQDVKNVDFTEVKIETDSNVLDLENDEVLCPTDYTCNANFLKAYFQPHCPASDDVSPEYQSIDSLGGEGTVILNTSLDTNNSPKRQSPRNAKRNETTPEEEHKPVKDLGDKSSMPGEENSVQANSSKRQSPRKGQQKIFNYLDENNGEDDGESDNSICEPVLDLNSDGDQSQVEDMQCAEEEMENVFMCHLCSDNFATRTLRQMHFRKKHSEIMSFACKYCSNTYVHQTVLLTHMSEKHHIRAILGKDGIVEDSRGSLPTVKNNSGENLDSSECLSREKQDQNEKKKKEKSSSKGEDNFESDNYDNSESDPDENDVEQQSSFFKLTRRSLRCCKCSKGFDSEQNYQQHIEKEHTGCLMHTCKYCIKKYTHEILLNVHIKTKHRRVLNSDRNPSESSCPICGNNVRDMEKHIRLAHQDGKYKCDLCSKLFFCVGSMKDHLRGVHYKELNLNPFQCVECDKTFRGGKNLRVHNRKIHNIGITIFCSICSLGVANKADLEKHILIVHKKEKPFMCDQCGKACADKYILAEHIETHSKHLTEKIKCDQCDKEFHGQRRLARHKRAIHWQGRMPFVCELCGVSFTRSAALKLHQRGTHYKELNLEPFKCSFCGVIFQSTCGMKEHEAKEHTKKWPISCPEEGCDKGFFYKRALEEHMRWFHTREKPFSCQFCDKKFFVKKTMVAHLQYHTKEFSFTCHLCSRGFPTRWALTTHLKKAHKIRPGKNSEGGLTQVEGQIN